MRLPLALLAIVPMSLNAIACGDAHRGNGASVAYSTVPMLRHFGGDYDPDDYNGHENDGDNDDSNEPRDRDNDFDGNNSNNKIYYDSDDTRIRAFGHAPSVTDRRAITRLVKHYFAVAATEDGQTACSMIVASMARAVPEDLGQPPGPPYLRGKTCAAVMSKLFKQNRRQLTVYSTMLEVTGVRLDRNRGVAVLGFTALPGRQIQVVREHGTWKIDALLDRELP